jgi:hypothetical protein
MADTKISDLAAAASIADSDLLTVVQGGVNKKIAKSAAAPSIRGWKEAAFYISQADNDAPVLTDIHNDTGATYTPAFTTDGDYLLTASSAVLTSGKTVAYILNPIEGASTKVVWASTTTLQILTFDNTPQLADSLLEVGIAILIIKIYN